jgi:Uma2 family endonuclease
MTDLVLDPAQTPTELSPYTPLPFRFTLAEYHRLHQQGFIPTESRVELIEGVIIQMAAVGEFHAGVVDYTSSTFNRLFFRENQIWIVRTQGPIVIGSSEPIPDVAILKPDPDFYRQKRVTAADTLLVVEVSESTLRYDQTTKHKLYATAEIPEYWVINLEHGCVIQSWNPTGGVYTQTQTLKRGETVTSTQLPILSLTVGSILGSKA